MGRPAVETVGRRCWEVVAGTDRDRRRVCHAGRRRLLLVHTIEEAA